MAQSNVADAPQKKASPPVKLRIGGEGFDVEVYNDIARSASLIDVRLIETNFSIQLDLIGALENADKTSAFDFSGRPESFFLYEHGTCAGTYVWTAEIKDKRKKALKNKAKYVIVYGNLKGKDREHVRLFFERLARFASFPYFRALMATHAAAAGLTLPPLPSIMDRVD
jgi:hypothetical protein